MHLRLRSLSLLAALLLAPFGARAAGTANLVNIATRVKVETVDNVGIAGFVIQGTGTKQVLIRALGPSLTARGVSGVLANPQMNLFDGATGALIASNDDWDQNADIQARHASLGITLPLANESVLSVALRPGAYTAVVTGVGGGTGIALVEVYDADLSAPCSLINIATRGPVRTSDGVMIGGFVIQGTVPKKVLIRGIGPSLSAAGVPNVLANPTIDVVNSAGTKIGSNDDWQTQPAQGVADVTATNRPPTDPRESALVMSLNPGAYTVIVSGVSAGVGNALVEVYDLEPTTAAPGQTNGSLYLGNLRPVPGVTTSGSGTAALSVSQDGLTAVVSVDYSNLTSAITNAHLEGPGGLNFFDLSPFTVRADGTWLWDFSTTNSNYTAAQILDLIRTGQVSIRVYTSTNPGGELVGAFSSASGSQTFTAPAAPPGLPGGSVTDADAARLLTQSTFGAKAADITSVKSLGLNGWLTAEFAKPVSPTLPYIDANWVNDGTMQNPRWAYASWWKNAVQADDQLRQRVAYAMSQILVVSTNSSGLTNTPVPIGAYYDTLLNGVFGNFRKLLEDITLNPGMGEFLDMVKNPKGNVAAGTNPNENYAREINQLFSIGLYQLYPDGTLQLDSRGLPIPTYTQDTIKGFARVFTGWTWYTTGTPSFNTPREMRTPMLPVPTQHEPGSKALLNGLTIPAVATATTANQNKDLKDALDNIFYHSNVGPFISRQLIQRLVTSNPSPGYVYRVSQIFANNGSGVRGDLKAVIKAILTDYEARTTDNLAFQGTGKEMEPILRVTRLMRAFNASAASGRFWFYLLDSNFGQTPLVAPTVFNFYTPDYTAPGDLANAGLSSPEFEITTDTTAIATANSIRAMIYGVGYSGLPSGTDTVKLDVSAYTALASTNVAGLIDSLNALLMNGQMSPAMRTELINTVGSISTAGTSADVATERARTAVLLISTSPQFAAQR